MIGDREEKAPRPPAEGGQAKSRKNAAALSAALRANLQRRKARQRALRETEAARERDGGDADETVGEANSGGRNLPM
ncbi:MAG: hypothetical protein C3F11_17875 [Methylocystaceae bacterium]|nr:MAG: hypothetical protein C3F11_17875 [Methylocystaceae bacterium]